MPKRLTPLVNGGFYHIYNHGIDLKETFTSKREYQHFQLAAWYYQPQIIPFKFSYYLNLSSDLRMQFMTETMKKDKAIKIHAYCLMRNHYHLLLEQLVENGISKFIGNLQNSYTKYFNIKHERKGPLFLSAFKAKQVQTEEQFLHVSRYIHLNPFSAQIVKSLEQLKRYPYCSLPDYFGTPLMLRATYTDNLLGFFKTREKFWKFITDQADYQRQLAHISHLLDY